MPGPRILVACDGCDASAAAVRAAGRLLPGADALVVTVAEGLGGLDGAAARVALPDEVVRTGVERLRERALETADGHARECAAAARSVGLEATARAVAAEGGVRPALLEVAREAQAELIVCGTRGRKRLVRALLGSVANGLLHDAELPLLVVPADAPDDDGPVVIGHDGSDEADRAIDVCARLLTRREVTIVHAWHSEVRSTRTGRALAAVPLEDLREVVAAFYEDARERAREAVVRASARADERRLRARAHCVESDDPPADVLLSAASEHRAAAVAVARRGRGALASSALGSVSASLVHAAERPVLLVP